MNANTVSFKDKSLDVDMANYMSKHDIVYLSPSEKNYDGFPIGNGDMGAMAWTPPDKIHFQINKCDTWDDSPPGSFGAWEETRNSDKSEKYTSLRSCGELSIIPGLPVFDWMYLDDFEGRLSLGKAEASWLAEGPLGRAECQAFVAHDPAVVVVHYSDSLSEAVARRVELARWGSRVFEHWYAMIKRDYLLGPEGTEAGCDGDEIWIEQPLRGMNFAMVCKICGTDAVSALRNSRTAEFELPPAKNCEFTLFVATVTSEEAENPLEAAREKVRAASREGLTKITKYHRDYWSDFWSKSFVDLSDDYLTNLWYMNVYQVGSSSQGKYPPHFISSLWSGNRDIRPWNHYYHWNQQQYTWPLNSSGHHDLMLPYAKWRLEGLPIAVNDAKNTYDCQGAVYFDVANRKGWQGFLRGDKGMYDPDISHNLTPGAQIALVLWRHYKYTSDEEFLKEYAYPIIRECTRFYLDYLSLGEDGRFHILKSSPYESWLRCRDTSSDLSHARKLLNVFIEASDKLGQDKELAGQADEVLNNLADFVYVEIAEGTEVDGIKQSQKKIMSCGIDLQTEKPAYIGYRGKEGKLAGAHVANAQMSSVFPTGLVGLDDEGTEIFDVLKNTLNCFTFVGGQGHNTIPICKARLGMSEIMESTLREWADRFQLFPQGFFSYFQRDYKEMFKKSQYGDAYSASHHTLDGLTNRVKILDSQPEEKINFPRSPFAHMGLEAGSVLETAINEMLLQSYSGKIRVFPAIPEKWSGTFKLHAIGGFIVSSEYKNLEILYVAIESKDGKMCQLINPWESESVIIRDMTEKQNIYSGEDDIIEFNTYSGHIYLVEQKAKPVSDFECIQITGNKNQKPKYSGRAILGRERQF